MLKLDALQEKPWYLHLAVFGVVALLVYGAFWYFVTRGTRAETREVEAKVEQPKIEKPVVREEPKFTAPIEVPREAPKEVAADFGQSGGVPGGVPEGVPGGEQGGVVGGEIGGVKGGVVGGTVGGVEGGELGGTPGGVPGGVKEPEPTPAPVPKGPVRVGGQVKAPRKLKNVKPQYSDLAREARVSGVVIIEAVIGTDGRVDRAKVLRGHPLLNDSAVNAVKQWVYSPTTLNGTAVPVIMTVTVNFTLGAGSGGGEEKKDESEG